MATPGGVTICKSARLGIQCNLRCYGEGEIYIGEGCYIGDYLTILSASKVEIGSHVLIANHLFITDENHGNNPECALPYGSQPLISSPVSIKEYCWIGEGVKILPGVSIGEWSIVAAGSIVTRNVPPYSLVMGQPAYIYKRYNFDKHEWVKV